eukprot:CFRG1448T1
MVLEKIKNAPGVLIKDPEKVARVLAEFQKGSHDDLQIVTDFDQTLTAYYMPDGTRVSSSHGLIEKSKGLVPELAAKLNELFNTYYPIEVSHSFSYEDKLAHMEYWWKKTNDAFIEMKFNKKLIPSIVAGGSSRFRGGFDEFMKKTKEMDIPVCILSAGVADIIRGVLEAHLNGLEEYPNLHIIANLMKFDEEGYAIDWEGEIIHVLNKKEVTIAGTDFGQQALKRHNLILMGDSLGDTQMSEGIEHANIVKIGYLNTNVEPRKQQFMDAFDIVILQDGDMEVANYIVDLATEGWNK